MSETVIAAIVFGGIGAVMGYLLCAIMASGAAIDPPCDGCPHKENGRE